MSYLFTTFPVIFIPLAVAVIVQAIKIVLYTAKHGWNPGYLLTHGHMPSAHTAYIVSLVTSAGVYEGVTSGVFAVAVALAIIVIDDAARLRMYMGDQGRYLNMLIRQLDIDKDKFPRLKERVGHRVSEVAVGAVIGFLFTLMLSATIG